VLLLGVSAILGATVLREPIAAAATPFQNVLVVNSDAQPVPVKPVGTASVNVTNQLSVQTALPADAFSYADLKLRL